MQLRDVYWFGITGATEFGLSRAWAPNNKDPVAEGSRGKLGVQLAVLSLKLPCAATEAHSDEKAAKSLAAVVDMATALSGKLCNAKFEACHCVDAYGSEQLQFDVRWSFDARTDHFECARREVVQRYDLMPEGCRDAVDSCIKGVDDVMRCVPDALTTEEKVLAVELLRALRLARRELDRICSGGDAQPEAADIISELAL